MEISTRNLGHRLPRPAILGKTEKRKQDDNSEYRHQWSDDRRGADPDGTTPVPEFSLRRFSYISTRFDRCWFILMESYLLPFRPCFVKRFEFQVVTQGHAVGTNLVKEKSSHYEKSIHVFKDGSVPYKVYIGKLPANTTADDLKRLFSSFGEIVEATVVTDPQTGKGLDFGFVNFSQEKSFRKSCRMNGKYISGNRIQVNPARVNERAGPGGRRNPSQQRRSK